MRFDDVVKARLRRGIMKRGQDLSVLLADVLAGKPVAPRLGALGVVGKPGMRPEEKLRWMLDQIELRRQLLDADDDAFGRCETCGVDLGAAALGELPWADRCQAHAHV